MKVGIRQKVLLEVLEKGSIAATSVDAQSDTSTLSLLAKSIKITVDKNFTVESNTDLMAVRFGVPANDDNGILVKEEGGVVIPAKEFSDWVKLQGSESTITMTLQKLATPEIINTLGDMGEADGEDKSKFCVKKIGTVKLASKGVSKTQTKWEIDCFDAEDKPTVNFSEKSEKTFEMQGQSFLECLDNVKFAALPKDPDHALDSISMQVYDKSLYFAATDMQHCALYKSPAEVDIQSNKPLLVSALLMDTVAKIINKDEKVVVNYSEEKEKVYISQTNLRVRLASTEKQKIGKFPSIELLLKKSYKPLTECSRSVMMGMLANASFINSSSALFVFVKENGTLTVKAMDEGSKLKPNIRQCELGNISRDAKAVWGVTHLLRGLKVIKSNDVQLHLPDNMNSLKITAKDNENFIYFTMAVSNPLYTANE
jgi:DNA polymerase III sliding clamp (beta) subunit (PCNA family)